MSFWPTFLVVLTLLLYVLPLLPGFIELLWPTDIKPLRVSQDYDSNPLHFADGFRSYIYKNFPEMSAGEALNGTLADGTPYQMVGEKGIPTDEALHGPSRLFVSPHSMNLPMDEVFETEIYSRQNITTGERSQMRALLSDRTLHIREHCMVMRWAHSEGDMLVDRHCRLYGRATSRQGIILREDVQFERLHAPIILFTARDNPPLGPLPVERTPLAELPDVKRQSGRRWVLNGHLDFPARHSFNGDIVTGTTAHIGDYAHIQGSLKSNAHDDMIHHLQNSGVMARNNKKKNVALCEIGNHVQIDGAVVSSHDLTIGRDCRITGPVIAENTLIIGSGTIVGSSEYPTTISAPHIIVESGAVVYGTIWAGQSGLVRSPQPITASEVAA